MFSSFLPIGVSCGICVVTSRPPSQGAACGSIPWPLPVGALSVDHACRGVAFGGSCCMGSPHSTTCMGSPHSTTCMGSPHSTRGNTAACASGAHAHQRMHPSINPCKHACPRPMGHAWCSVRLAHATCHVCAYVICAHDTTYTFKHERQSHPSSYSLRPSQLVNWNH